MTRSVYHLGLNEKLIKGGKFAFLPGDPDRVPEIARAFDEHAKEVACNREFRTWVGKINKQNILVTSTGIGASSASIAVEELAQIGVTTFIRIGTCGAIQKGIKIADVIITTGAVRLDGASTHYAPIEYPAVADFEVTSCLIEAAKSLGIRYHVGISASSATFYPGQERYDTYSKYVIRGLRGALKEWQKLNVLHYEMESAMLLTMSNALGLRAGCVTGVVDNRTKQERIEARVVNKAENNAIRVAIKAMGSLIP